MNNSDLLRLQAYDYHLPPELIAQEPMPNRRESRLMHLKRSQSSITNRNFSEIEALLNPGDVLVANSSKVFPARLYAKKENGTPIEILMLHQIENLTWKVMIFPAKRVKVPQWLIFSDNLKGYIGLSDAEGLREISFECKRAFWDEIYAIGHMPLPPYIDRSDNIQDIERYQTVYAKELGSVAAPTAGLHFDQPLLDALARKGIIFTEVVLHVGIGTFRPVKTELITDHVMHSELASISPTTAEIIQKAKDENRRVVCVGTTSTRTVESFWQNGAMQHGSKWTDIFIYPGIKFNVTDALITNFHLPQSTLLMMISAFAGYSFVIEAYQQAIENKYRFFSYGDAMFIED